MVADQAWLKFERLVAAIEFAKSQGAEVKWNDKIKGRQFDVTLRLKVELNEYLTVIECKDYRRKIPVEKIEAFVTKARGMNANKAVMVSSNGYQSGCYEVAQQNEIKLYTINKKVTPAMGNIATRVTPALNIYDVYLVRSNGEQVRLDEEGGRFDYLMKYIQLISKTKTVTPMQAINQWQQFAYPYFSFDKEKDATIALNKNTIAKIPFENDMEVVAIRFKCKLIEAYVTNQPTFDRYILESLGTSYEMIDEKGEIIHKAYLPSLIWGFDTKVFPGKYYVSPPFNNYHYCRSIEGDIITWILLESYQHGNLLQATFETNKECSCLYFEVTDKKRLDRLRKLLEIYPGR